MVIKKEYKKLLNENILININTKTFLLFGTKWTHAALHKILKMLL